MLPLQPDLFPGQKASGPGLQLEHCLLPAETACVGAADSCIFSKTGAAAVHPYAALTSMGRLQAYTETYFSGEFGATSSGGMPIGSYH